MAAACRRSGERTGRAAGDFLPPGSSAAPRCSLPPASPSRGSAPASAGRRASAAAPARRTRCKAALRRAFVSFVGLVLVVPQRAHFRVHADVLAPPCDELLAVFEIVALHRRLGR